MQQQQPFFKMSNNSHYFSLERFSSHFGQEKRSAPKPVAQNFFKQPSAKLKEVGIEAPKHEQHTVLELSGTEKMSGLYSRIHQEAERLQKWKTAIVSELKQKDQQLEEANTNSELLRKSLVDLQETFDEPSKVGDKPSKVENENLSSSLQNEKLAHQEMRQQIHTTRNMCIALKDHVARVETTIEQGEADKEELKHNEQQIIDTYQELAEQFKQLQLHSASEQEYLRSQVEDLKKQNIHLVDKNESTITAAGQKIQSLEDEVAHHKTAIAQLQKEVDYKSSQCVELKECLDALEEEFQSSKKEGEDKTVQLNAAMADLNTKLSNNKHLQDELNQLKGVLNQTEIQLRDRQNLLKIKEQSIYQLEEQVNHIKATLKDTENRLELNEKRFAEDKNVIADLNSNIILLEGALERYKREVESIENDKELLNRQLHEAQDELKSVMEAMNEEKMKLLNQKTSLKDEIQLLREDLKACQIENEEYHRKLILMKEIVEKKETELSEVAKKSIESIELMCDKLLETLHHAANASDFSMEEVDKKCPMTINALIVKCITVLCDQREEAKSVNKTLVNENMEMEESVKELKQSLNEVTTKLEQQEQLLADNEKTGISNVKSLEKEIKSHSKQVNTLTSKNLKLQAQLDTKSQMIYDLKSEVKKHRDILKEAEKKALLLNHQLYDDINEKDKLLSEYAKEIQQLKVEIVKKSKSIIDVEEKLRSELESITTLLHSAENEGKKFKEQSQVYLKQHSEDKKKFDQEMSEMCATLEKYKAENQKMLSQKDKEIEILREYQRNNTNAMEVSHQLEAEIIQLKIAVGNISQEKDIAMKEQKSAMILVENLKKQLNEKDYFPVKNAQVAKLPMSIASTPQLPASRGILKQVGSNKKGSKRVAFVSSGSDQSDVETDVLKKSIIQANTTPVHSNECSKLKSTPSPNVRIAPSLRNLQECATSNDNEMNQFKELFPNYAFTDQAKDVKAGFKRNTKSNDVKSTPNKSFKYSSLSVSKKGSSRTGKKGTSSKHPDMSWFEIDPVFGFTAED